MRTGILFFLITALFLFAPLANAANVEFSYPSANEQWIDGFVVYETQGGQAVELHRTTDKASRLITADLGVFGTDCRSFFMAPFRETKVGPYSDVFEWCPEQQVPETIYIPADKIQGIIVRP